MSGMACVICGGVLAEPAVDVCGGCTPRGRRVPLGVVVATPGALESFGATYLSACLSRHARGDWGDLAPEDRAANDAALRDGNQILSAYTAPTGAKLWVITEHNRSVTTMLLPEDY